MDNYVAVLQKYAVFSGRASRKEYWMFVLFNFLIAIGLGFVTGVLNAAAHINLSFLGMIYSLAVLCPGIAVGVRRLHDTDRSGLWVLTGLIPFIGGLVLLVLMCMEGTAGDNRFGPNPYRMPAIAESRF